MKLFVLIFSNWEMIFLHKTSYYLIIRTPILYNYALESFVWKQIFKGWGVMVCVKESIYTHWTKKKIAI